MKATITNNTESPKGFYVGFAHKKINIGESIEGDFDKSLLDSLVKIGGLTIEVAEEKKTKSEKAEK